MDFFSRVFSSNSHQTSRGESNNTSNKSQSGLEDSGSYYQASRVDQIQPLPSFDKDHEIHYQLPADVIARTLDRWNPETCIRLLRMPSVQNYSGLRKLISESDTAWMIEFLEMGGLEVLFESVDRLSNRNSNKGRLEHTLLLLQGVSCLKAVTNSHNVLEYVTKHKEYGYKLSQMLGSKNPLVKKQLLDFMSTLCVFSQEGHHLTLDILETYKITHKLRYRFIVLLEEIKKAEVFPHVATLLTLINCIILGASRFAFRIRLRNEFIALGLLELLESLKQLPDDEVRLQCDVFQKSQMADEEHARSIGISSSFSHFALFQALLDKVEDTPLSSSFGVLLQNLNQLDPSDRKTDYVWNILEEITERAINCPEEILRKWILTESRRLNMRTCGTQTLIHRTSSSMLSLEEGMVRRRRAREMMKEDDATSIKSYDSRDSGMPVSRSQSFGNEEPESHVPSLRLSNPEDSEVEIPQENVEGEKQRPPSKFFKSIGLSFMFIRSSSRRSVEVVSSTKDHPQTEVEVQEIPSAATTNDTFVNFRSESPVSKYDVPMDKGNNRAKKTFSFPFFNKSKKYSLNKTPPQVFIHPPSPDIGHKEMATLASLRDGMTSLDVKRSRQRAKSIDSYEDGLSQMSFDSDTSSLSSQNSQTLSNFSTEIPVPRKLSDTNENVSKSSTNSSVSQSPSPPPPPPPPPPPMYFNSNVNLDLPRGSSTRSSWSAGCSLSEFQKLDKKTIYNTLPKPKTKMKTLNWAKIPSSHVNVQSIWNEINEDSKAVDINFEEVEQLFCQEQAPKYLKPPKMTQKQRINKQVTLLDSKKSLNIGIFLKQFKHGVDEVVDIVQNFKHEEIGAEKLRALLNLLPDTSEVKSLKSYSGDVSNLGMAEKFVLRLNAVENLELRIEGMLLLEEFPITIQLLHESVQALLDASNELLNNQGLKNFFKLILVAGNFINSGSYAGNAVGFRLSTLPKLAETRANSPRITLLHYLVEEAKRKDKESLKFINDLLELLGRCSRLTLENLSGEINHLKRDLNSIDAKLKGDATQLNKRFGIFIQNGIKHVAIIEKKMAEIRNLSNQLAKRFCEDENRFQLEECLNIIHIFCLKIKAAESENQARKVAESKHKKSSQNFADARVLNTKNGTI